MIKCIDQVRELASRMRATVDLEHLRDGGVLAIDAPCGYVWDCNGLPAIYVNAENYGRTCHVAASREAVDLMTLGLRLADEDERIDIEYDRDEPWQAADGSPERIDYPR